MIVFLWIVILLIGILQTISGPLAIITWNINYALQYETSDISFYGKGVPSLFPNAIPYSYFLTGQIILVFNFFKSKVFKLQIGSKFFYYIWIISVVSAILVSDRRSAQLAFLAGFIFTFYNYFLDIICKNKINKILLSSIVTIAITISIIFSGQDNLTRKRNLVDTSIKQHLYLFPASILDMISDPFNVYPIFKNYEFLGIDSEVNLENISLHNGLSTFKRRYTIVSLVGLFITLRLLYKPFNSFKYIVLLIYALNMLFHNNIIFIQDPWGIIALSFTLL